MEREDRGKITQWMMEKSEEANRWVRNSRPGRIEADLKLLKADLERAKENAGRLLEEVIRLDDSAGMIIRVMGELDKQMEEEGGQSGNKTGV